MRLQENAEWVAENFGECELGHVKRVERLSIMANNMLESPESSLPQQNSNWSDLKAAYRLCGRKEVTFDTVAECHWKQTRQTQPGRYLLISDTTDISHYSHQATTAIRPLRVSVFSATALAAACNSTIAWLSTAPAISSKARREPWCTTENGR